MMRMAMAMTLEFRSPRNLYSDHSEAGESLKAKEEEGSCLR